MEKFTKFLSLFFNILGLTNFTSHGKSWKSSKVLKIKNLLQCLVFSAIEIYFVTFIDFSLFLPEGHSVEDFTSFSMKMYRLIGQLPMIMTCFLTLSHLMKNEETLDLIDWFLKFYCQFKQFSKCKKFMGIYFIKLFVFMILVRVISVSFLLQWDILVSISYLSKMYSDLFLAMFLFAFICFVNYIKFLLLNFNNALKKIMSADVEIRQLENSMEMYQRIFENVQKFYSLFYLEIALVLLHFIVKAVLMVRNRL